LLAVEKHVIEMSMNLKREGWRAPCLLSAAIAELSPPIERSECKVYSKV
jgi:hypothetical protein